MGGWPMGMRCMGHTTCSTSRSDRPDADTSPASLFIDFYLFFHALQPMRCWYTIRLAGLFPKTVTEKDARTDQYGFVSDFVREPA